MKLTLTDTKSGYNLTPINANFEALEQELQNKVLYRDNPSGEPNQMENSLDMNSNDVLNVNNLSVASFKINGEDSTQFLNDSVVEAYNWAQYAEDLPVPEGDGTEFSAYHYSIKAGDSADAAETAEDGAELALYNFNGTWYGALASDPVQDPNGDPITEGDIYLNITEDVVKFYSGGMWNPLGGGNVTSAFGRTGAVVAQSGDYDADQVTYDNSTSGLTATAVQAAIDEVHDSTPEFRSEVITLNGDFNGGEQVLASRVGDVVTLASIGILGHVSSANPDSADVIPLWAQPNNTAGSVFAAQSFLGTVNVVNGFLSLAYRDLSGSNVLMTDSVRALSITYHTTNSIT